MKSVELLDKEGKPTKTLKSTDAIVYPTVACDAKGGVGESPPLPPGENRCDSPHANDEKKEDSGNLAIYLGIGGGIGLVAVAFGGLLLFKGKKKASVPVKKYQRQPATETIVEERPPPKPALKADPSPGQAKGDDNPFANFE